MLASDTVAIKKMSVTLAAILSAPRWQFTAGAVGTGGNFGKFTTGIKNLGKDGTNGVVATVGKFTAVPLTQDVHLEVEKNFVTVLKKSNRADGIIRLPERDKKPKVTNLLTLSLRKTNQKFCLYAVSVFKKRTAIICMSAR
jgi:hypothetical protein